MKNKILFEVLSLAFTLVLLVLIMLPVYLNTVNFEYYYYNTICVFVVLTLIRYMFLLKHTLIARATMIKIVLGVLCIPLFLFATDGLYEFQRFLDEEGLQTLVSNVYADRQPLIINYIRSEFLFFGISAVILSIIFPFRMVLSVWRVRNRNTV